MAETLEALQAQLDVLRDARATGIRTVEYDGRRVEYRSDSELAAAISDVERRAAALRSSPVKTIYFVGGKGA